MGEIHLSAESEAELDDIWLYIARDSGSEDIATRVVEGIRRRFSLLGRHPYIGRQREDLRPDVRSFVADNYRIIHPDTVLILHIFHGRRDIGRLLE